MLLTDVARVAPAVFADKPIMGVSERYNFIPTTEMINHLSDNGYVIRKVQQRNSRKPEKKAFAKHMIQFRKEGDIQVGDVFPEGILINSHDGTTPFVFRMGFYRFVCSNGLIVGDSVMPPMKLKHSGNTTIDLVLDTLDNQWKMFEDMMPILDDMRHLILTQDQQKAFAQYTNETLFFNSLMDYEQLLKVRRWDDSSNDLWTVFNRVQENALKGGLFIPNKIEGTKRQMRNPIRRSRKITGIDSDVSWNTQLWDQAVEFLEVLQ
jgi:hypothetical protein